MKTRVLSVLSILLVADVYFFQAVKALTANPLILVGYWCIDLLLVAGMLFVMVIRKPNQSPPRLISTIMALLLILMVPKLCAMPVLLVEDIIRLFRGFPPRSELAGYIALAVAAVPFLGLIYGLTGGRHDYRVRKETLYFDDLPEEFDGFTITQLSDIHAGSFTSAKGVEKGIAMVNAQKSDVILFTGDLVNNEAAEMDRWIPTFARLKAAFGKFSVLGNHDYGDYKHWTNEHDKHANLDRLKEVHTDIGFKLLLNEATTIKKEDESISLIGVENWGKGGFHKYGDLKKATSSVPAKAFKILMSHDPSHWDAVTLGHDRHIHLTLAGHTHGAQFGIELFGFKWSPIKYIYKQWAGLYKQAGKYLYVNRGFGFLGLKGRVGIWPEITVITLRTSTT
jgi:predicted MPP superfamily phosphohydrolase